jgi:long-chain acyl-CoA synthetase
MSTIITKFESIAKEHGRRTALAFLQSGKYQQISYDHLNNYRLQIAHWWQDKHFIKGQKIAVLLSNSPEWVMTDLAAATLGLIVLPLHTTYNQAQLDSIIKHAEIDYLVTDGEHFNKNKQIFLANTFKKIIVIGQTAADEGVEHWPLLKYQKNIIDIKSDLSPDDTHTIIYTSGTTGDPKGVMLSHQNIVTDVESAKRNIEIKSTDKFFSFLPLSHAFERTSGYYAAIFSGASIYFAQSSKTIIDDIKKAKPTILTSVPRIFEKVYDKIFDKVRSGSKFKREIFYQALNLSRSKRAKKIDFWHKLQLQLLDKIVFKKIRDILGGHLRMAVSGGASLNPTIAKFFENLNLPIIEGYGLTETSPIVAVNKFDNYKFGTVGLPLDCNQIKIADNKEILIKGDNVMKGYYDNQEATDAVLRDGWFYTGDLGFIDERGFLTIIGRAKDMIVLSTGKNIFPEPIENILNESKYISQSFVYGDKDKNISALIVPDFEELAIWCRKHEVDFSLPDVLSHDSVLKLYQEKITKKLDSFSNIEQINNFRLLDKEFSQENSLLTPTLKLRRSKIIDTFIN